MHCYETPVEDIIIPVSIVCFLSPIFSLVLNIFFQYIHREEKVTVTTTVTENKTDQDLSSLVDDFFKLEDEMISLETKSEKAEDKILELEMRFSDIENKLGKLCKKTVQTEENLDAFTKNILEMEELSSICKLANSMLKQ